MGRSTGNAYKEDNLVQQIMALREEVLKEIFLDIQKTYDDLDRNRCLEILVAYGVGPQDLCRFQHCWDRLTMLLHAWGYFGTPFKGYCRVTQGDPLYPTIFNLFVDAVL